MITIHTHTHTHNEKKIKMDTNLISLSDFFLENKQDVYANCIDIEEFMNTLPEVLLLRLVAINEVMTNLNRSLNMFPLGQQAP